MYDLVVRVCGCMWVRVVCVRARACMCVCACCEKHLSAKCLLLRVP